MLSLIHSVLMLSAIFLPASALVIRTGETLPSVLSRQSTNSLGCAPFSALLPSPTSGGTMRRDHVDCLTTCTNGAYLYAATAAGGSECICTNTLDASQLIASDADGNCPAGDLAITITGAAITTGTSSAASTAGTVTATDSTSTATDLSSTATPVLSPSASLSISVSVDTVATTDIPSSTGTLSTSADVVSTTAESVTSSSSSTLDATSSATSPTDIPFTFPSPTDTSVATPTDVSSVASPSSATSTGSPAASASPPASTTSYTSLGCYAEPIEHDFNFRALTNYSSGFIPDLTVEGCISTCASLNLPYAGLEFGSECLCGDGIYNGGNPAPNGDCSAQCTGDLSEKECGGTFLFSLYVDMDYFDSLRAQLPEA